MVYLKLSSIHEAAFYFRRNQRIVTAGSKRTDIGHRNFIGDISHMLHVCDEAFHFSPDSLGRYLACQQYISVETGDVDMDVRSKLFTDALGASRLDTLIFYKHAARAAVLRHCHAGAHSGYHTGSDQQGAAGKKRKRQ